MNITNLKIWPELVKLGFEPIKYRSHGKVVCVGASLMKELTSISGENFKTDIITIEPKGSFTDRQNYHITGDIKTPFIDKFYRYEYGRKVEFFDTVAHMNNFFKATDILKTVKLMLS